MKRKILQLMILLLIPFLAFNSCKEEEEEQEVKKDYSSLFNYDVYLYVNNMTEDEDIILQLVYLDYKREYIKPGNVFFKTKIKAIDLINYFNIDTHLNDLQDGQIKYILTDGTHKHIIKVGYINKNDNIADNIIIKENGKLIVSGSNIKHLD